MDLHTIKRHIKVIGFDADDTLWVNEPFFRQTEDRFCQLMERYCSPEEAHKQLYDTEIANLPVFGYGIKNLTLSMVESAIVLSNGTIDNASIVQIIQLGKQMTQHPVELLPDVQEVLAWLSEEFRLIVVTKGDLKEQERKLELSGLERFFHHIEIVSEKHEANYIRLIHHLDIQAEEFLMVGNSLKSDILPPLSIGCYAVHIPFETTWLHEQVKDSDLDAARFLQLDQLSDLKILVN